jgi:four helix bundle protein
MAFGHEKLKVYEQALHFNVRVSEWVKQWDSKYAVCDQLDRAACSIVENIAMASAAHSTMKMRSLDYAIGSALECAACLDLAGIWRLMKESCVTSEKVALSQSVRMLVGLRKSWSPTPSCVREDEEGYGVEDKILFHHERLDVYRVALETASVFAGSEATGLLPKHVFRRLDELLTSMTLNIAEGNGRFSGVDQRRFLETAHEAAVKMSARLDLCMTQDLMPPDDVRACKERLERVGVMTWVMTKGLTHGEERQG